MLDTVIFSLIKGLPFSIKKKLIEDHKSPKKAIDNLKISLRGVSSKTGLKILNQINSSGIVEKAEKVIQECMEVLEFLVGCVSRQLVCMGTK